jgi:diguanylate cyclase (GGDEF)-like protein
MQVVTNEKSDGKWEQTQWAQMQRPTFTGDQDAYLVHIYPTGPAMGARYALGDAPLVLGRSDDCDILIVDKSVSRTHARIERDPDGFFVTDLQSTNGTFVNDVLIATARLKDGDYLRIGNCICRFLAGDNVEAEYHEEIYRLTIIDGLTEIYNKRYLLEHLDQELGRSFRHNRPLSLIMFDIDHFKTINDKLKHLGGDFTLRELAGCVRKNIRRGDLFARYGGEEFVLMLPETTHEGAVELAEQVRTLVAAHPFQFEDQSYQVTVSLGVASTQGQPLLGPEDFIGHADHKLYQAKEQGRNRVVG